MSQAQSKTEQLIYRNSYRKHRERLSDIKHHQTAKDFHLPKRPDDKKGFMRTKDKQDQILYENFLLKDKIAHIKQRNGFEPPLASLTEQLRNQVRYEEDSKLDIKSDLEDGQPVRCIIPTGRTRVASFEQRNKPNLGSYYAHKTKYVTSTKKRPESFHRNNANAERAVSQNKQRDNQMLYNLPERNQLRQVIHHKTVILSPMKSCLFELSLIGERMLIAAHIMGLESYCLTQLLSSKMTKQLLNEYENNYEELYPRILLQEVKQKYHSIRILPKESETETKQRPSEEELNKLKVKVQNNFLQRNYYTQLKKDGTPTSESPDKPTITHEKLQELMDRLALPAKRYHVKDGGPIPPIPEPAKNQHFQQSKLSIHVDSKATEQRKANMQKCQEGTKISVKSSTKRSTPLASTFAKNVKLKQTDSIEVDKSHRSISHHSKSIEKDSSILDTPASPKNDKQKSKKSQEYKDDEEEVEYLDGEEQYQESFENPSSISKGNKLANKSGLNQSDKNNSFVSQKSKKSKNPQKNESKEYSNIDEDYENEYEPMLESDVHPITPKPKVSKPESTTIKPAPAVQEQEYAQQFQT